MGETIVCLGCGGLVGEAGQDGTGIGDGSGDGDGRCLCATLPLAEARRLRCSGCGGPLAPGARGCPHCQATVATRRCDRCLAWNLAEASHCNGCGRGLGDASRGTSGRELDAAPLPCPRCSGRLTPRAYAALEVDECDACGGLMVAPSTMDRIVSARDASTALHLALPKRPYQRDTNVRYLACPACAKSMNRKAFGRISGVIVDVCRDHGVWFDAGELGEVIAFIERGGLEEARRREAAELHEAVASRRSEQRATTATGLTPRVSGQRDDPTGVDLGREILHALAGLWR